ncbi:MAG: hypothetical protein KDE31_09415 [Caldilineaceae bacterium]|nr:hypothetical protein [Caldilineaceae bacterium]
MPTSLSSQPLVESLVRSTLSDHPSRSEADDIVLAVVDPAMMTEGEFMTYILHQFRTGQRVPVVSFTEEELETMAEEPIGEHFARYPFLY